MFDYVQSSASSLSIASGNKKGLGKSRNKKENECMKLKAYCTSHPSLPTTFLSISQGPSSARLASDKLLSRRSRGEEELLKQPKKSINQSIKGLGRPFDAGAAPQYLLTAARKSPFIAVIAIRQCHLHVRKWSPIHFASTFGG